MCVVLLQVTYVSICRLPGAHSRMTRLILVTDGLGYLKVLAPPEKILRWIEGKLNLLGRLPHYVSIDQKTYGRYGVLPTASGPSMPGAGEGSV